MIKESRQLDEDLGNLAQLKLGNLANLLKQDRHTGIGTKFTKNAYYGPGNTSEIIDAGVLKNGIQGLRKAYRSAQGENDPIVAFAIYLNNKAVAFGLYDADKLAGKTREGDFAYDLSGFEAQIEAAHEKENEGVPSWRQSHKIPPTSSYDKKDYHYPRGYNHEREDIIRKFVGSTESTGEMAAFLAKLDQIAELLGGTLTLKLVTADRKGQARGQERRNAAIRPSDFTSAAEDLKKRLARYKNAKRPTAENIQQFLEMATKGAASVVNFGNNSWSTTAGNGYGDKIDPVSLLNGKPFTVEYKSAEPGSYATLKISYRYDKRDNMIRPWQAQWSDKESKSKVAVMDPEYWTKTTLGVPNLEKPTVIKQMLTRIKESPSETTFNTIEKVITSMRSMGEDWPEFKIIEKSIATERAAKEQK